MYKIRIKSIATGLEMWVTDIVPLANAELTDSPVIRSSNNAARAKLYTKEEVDLALVDVRKCHPMATWEELK